MKKALLTLIALAILSVSAYAEGDKHKAGTVALPHLMKILLSNSEELKITTEQQKKFDKMVSTVPSKLHPMMDEAATLEKKIKKAVMKDKQSLKDVSDDINKLEKLKREIAQTQINAINKIQNILTESQYNSLLLKMKKNKAC